MKILIILLLIITLMINITSLGKENINTSNKITDVNMITIKNN